MNIVIDVTCLIFGFTLISAGYCVKSVTKDITSLNIWYNEIDDYWLVFIVSVSLFHKILNTCQN